jgi:kinetochore-associated protein 1
VCKYELTMPDIAWLVHQPKSSVNMYYMSGSKLDTEHIQEIEMKIISETDPFQRLLKLIQRGHLAEAEVRCDLY